MHQFHHEATDAHDPRQREEVVARAARRSSTTAAGNTGTPSITDFLVLEVPGIRDGLAADVVWLTRPTPIEGVRVYINGGVLVPAVLLYMFVDDLEVEAPQTPGPPPDYSPTSSPPP